MVNAIIKLDEKTELIIERVEEAAERAEEAARQAGKIRDYLALLGVAAPGVILTGVLANAITQPFAPTPTLTGTGPTPPPMTSANDVFNLIKNLIDQEVQLFLQGFISAAQLAAYVGNLGFTTALQVDQRITAAIASIPQAIGTDIGIVDREINALVPGIMQSIGVAYAIDINQVNNAIAGVKNVYNKAADILNGVIDSIPFVPHPHIPKM